MTDLLEPGGGEGTRTLGLYIANVALYQLSYTPGRARQISRCTSPLDAHGGSAPAVPVRHRPVQTDTGRSGLHRRGRPGQPRVDGPVVVVVVDDEPVGAVVDVVVVVDDGATGAVVDVTGAVVVVVVVVVVPGVVVVVVPGAVVGGVGKAHRAGTQSIGVEASATRIPGSDG